ncbi:MAG: hypothetical protein ACJAZ8_000234 [Planctomycetota bacterium]|jgi:hypothetical protein
MLKIIDKLPLPALVIGALFLGGAPFSPEPHLLEKLRMLTQGSLRAPMDWFDLVMHGFLPALLLLRLGRMALRPKPESK